MDYYKIPVKFFEAIRQKDARFQVLWMRWICYGEEIKNPEILEKLIRENQNEKVSGALIREIYEFGLPFMRDSLFSSQKTTTASQDEKIAKMEKALATFGQILKERTTETTDIFRRLLEAEDSIENLSKRDSVIEKMAEKIGLIEEDIADLRKEQEETVEQVENKPDSFDKFQPKDDITLQVLSYLNELSGAQFSHKAKKNKELIKARQKEGYTLEDFKTVIRKKCEEWKNSEQERYLRPITLFSPTKFENYLNQPEIRKHIPQNQFSSVANAVSKASEYFTMGGNGE